MIATLLLAISIALSRNNTGVRQLPKDTMIVNGVRMVGVIVPVNTIEVPGDVTRDGAVGAADIIALVRLVFQAKPPLAGDSIGVFLTNDSLSYLFIPFSGVRK